MGTDPMRKAEEPEKAAAKPKTATLSAARLAVAVRRAATDAGENAALLGAEPIAIVGMGCRFPGGADGLEAYWRLLEEGRSGIRMLPEGRWVGARERMAPHLLMGGWLEAIDQFDAEFFGIAPREANTVDPQQRLLLEVVWEALSDAGIAPSSLSGSDAGVYVAVYNSDYARLQFRDEGFAEKADGQAGIGAAHSIASGRISFLLNLRGPCMTVDTACSSSLSATHLACQALRRRESGVALVAGASLKLLPDEIRAFAQWGMLASDGRAKTFDARADGFVPGEGCGVLVLKRLSDAVAQGDRIHAVIRGTAVNHDGRSSVLTAPNGPAQEAVIRAALRLGQVDAADVSYVETHGTGTSLGDPIEVEALDAVYGAAAGGACVLGAVKTNVGHLEAAAGVAGVIKAVLALEHESIPRNLHFERLNPQIQLRPSSRIALATEAKPWRRVTGQTRFAAVSSFGLGGTNAHVILEEAPALPAAKSAAGAVWLLPIAAHTAEGLLQLGARYAELLRRPGADLSAMARSAARGRDHGAFRMAARGATAAEAAEQIEERLRRVDLSALQSRVEKGAGGGGLGLVFSGQGSLWAGAMRALGEAFPAAEKVLAECERITQAVAGWSLRSASEDESLLRDTAKAQPVLFAVEAALGALLEAWGVTAVAVAGHSVGEVAAAVCCGVLTLEEGMRLVLRRGSQMAQAGPGRMLAAAMDEAAAMARAAQAGVAVAAVNGPRAVVFAGAVAAMEALEERLRAEGVESRWLDVEYAFHSEAMDAAARRLTAELAAEFPEGGDRRRRGAVQMVSTVTGGVWQPGDGDAAYWGRGIRERVRFREAVEELGRLGCTRIVEVGPHPVLLRAAGETLRDAETVASMRRGQEARGTLLALAAALYEAGWDLRWEKIYPGAPSHAELPGYPWEKRRYWLTGEDGGDSGSRSPELRAAGQSLETASWSGVEIASPFVAGRLLMAQLSTRTTPWLGEHRFLGTAILPFAAWLEMARRAAEVAAGGAAVLRDFAVAEKLLVGEAAVSVQTLAAEDGRVRMAVRQEAEWREVAGGRWQAAAGEDGLRVDLKAWLDRPGDAVDVEAVYAGLKAGGLEYGPAFRGLKALKAGPGWAVGEIDAGRTRDAGGVPPALLDACLQVLAAARAGRGETVLPVSVREYRVMTPAGMWPEGGIYALADLREKGADAEADVKIVSAEGSLLAEIAGLTIRRVGVAPQWQLEWQAEQAEKGEFAVAPGVDLCESVRAAAPAWGEAGAVLLHGRLDAITDGVLQVVAREQAAAGAVERICVMTRGAQAAAAGDRMDAEQAAVWGLVRTLRAEYPAIAVVLADLPAEDEDEATAALAGWMRKHSDRSAEVAVRGGRVLVPRIRPAGGREGSAKTLTIGMPGLLETLREVADRPREPKQGEVQIAARAHGLNFRDVLTAMGTYAGTVAPMGAECAGVVVRAGEGSVLQAGDAVMAFAPASLRSMVTLPEAYVVKKPAAMQWAEAAGVPVAFLTAQYGFAELAKLQPGQSVLVHSAAGGLGQAAVQLARRMGARVLATAGSEAKRQWLREQGVADVFDSRSESFADEVLRVTDGRGVDVVLNSLPLIAAGFRALAQGGAFLEVGKRDIWSAERVAAERKDARYWAFDLGEVAMREPELIQRMLREIVQAMEEGALQPVASECFAIEEAEAAFRKMAGGRHRGKLVLMRDPSALPEERWRSGVQGGSAVITGGTGALGTATARWLLSRGAARVTLVSRSGASAEASALMEEFGERVRVARADVTDRAAMAAVLAAIRNDAPLRVVVHAAGEARDGVLAEASAESLAAAMRTKVEGARVLAELTADDDLLATVYYSSLTGVVGAAGQAGYAAANAFLDGLAEERNGRGLRTQSVAWGAWGGGGMAARLTESAAARAERQGFRPMSAGPALDTLEAALLAGRSQVAIADMDWERLAEPFATGPAAEFFAKFLPVRVRVKERVTASTAGESGAGALAEILAGPKAEQLERMEGYLRQAARKVLGLSQGRPMPADTALQEMGLDSLMALELRNVLAQAAGRPLSATLLFDYPTIRGLSAYLLGLLTEESAKAEVAETVADAAAVEAMSDAEAEALLLAELDELEKGELERKGTR